MSVTVTLIRLPKTEIDKGKQSHKKLEESLTYPHRFPFIWFDSSREIINYFYCKCKIEFPWGNKYRILVGEHIINDKMEGCYGNPIRYFKKEEIIVIAEILPKYFNTKNISPLWNDEDIKGSFDNTPYTREDIIGKMILLADFFNAAKKSDECILTIWE